MDSERAAEVISGELVRQAFIDTMGYITKLVEGEAVATPESFDTDFRGWYLEQTEQSRAIINELVRLTARTAVANTAAFLDGVTGMICLGDARAELALSLRLYNSVEMAVARIQDVEIPVSPCEEGDFLNELVLNLIEPSMEHVEPGHSGRTRNLRNTCTRKFSGCILERLRNRPVRQ